MKQQYIALLRGINVGSHIVKMDLLRSLFEDLGFQHVRSFIQSGNIFFESSQNKDTLQPKIEKHLKEKLGFVVPVILRTVDEIEKMLQSNPFKNNKLTPDSRFAVTFFAHQIDHEISVQYKTPDGGYELVGKTEKELFIIWHLINGRPGTVWGELGGKLQKEGTTRFWHTTEKILKAAKRY